MTENISVTKTTRPFNSDSERFDAMVGFLTFSQTDRTYFSQLSSKCEQFPLRGLEA